jgi:hypothetical protein
MASMLQTIILETQNSNRHLLPQGIDDFVSTNLACIQRAINATVHSITKESPGAFIFQHDMLLQIQSFARIGNLLEPSNLKTMSRIYFVRINVANRLTGSQVWRSSLRIPVIKWMQVFLVPFQSLVYTPMELLPFVITTSSNMLIFVESNYIIDPVEEEKSATTGSDIDALRQ